MIPIFECFTGALIFGGGEHGDEMPDHLVGTFAAVYAQLNNLVIPVLLAFASRLMTGASFSLSVLGGGFVVVAVHLLCQRILHGQTLLCREPLLTYTCE